MSTLPDRVRERLDATGLNPFSAAKRAGLNEDYVRNILRGRTQDPGAAKLKQLADVLVTTPEWLLTGGGPQSQEPRGEPEVVRAPPRSAEGSALRLESRGDGTARLVFDRIVPVTLALQVAALLEGAEK